MATTINTTGVSRVFDYNAQQYICLVENSKGEFSADGHKIEYTVRHLKGKGLTCTCKAGENGVPCWHKRAAVAYCQALRQEQQEQSLLESLVRQGFSRDEATRITYAKPQTATAYELRQMDAVNKAREFSLLKK